MGLCALGQYAVVDLTHYWSSAAQYKAAPRSQVKQAGINGKPIQAFTLLRRLVLMRRAQCNDSLPFA